MDFVWNKKGNWPGNMVGKPDKSDIGTLVEAMRDGDAPPFFILEQEEPDLVQALEEAGIRRIRQWTGMQLEPGQFLPPEPLADLEVAVDPTEGLEAWMELGKTEVMGGARMDQEVAESLERDKDFHCLLASNQGEAVSCGLLFTHDQVGGIYMVGTRSTHRGKGYASLVLTRMVSLALEGGCRKLVLHATGLGEGLYRRLGFKAEGRLSIHWYLGG